MVSILTIKSRSYIYTDVHLQRLHAVFIRFFESETVVGEGRKKYRDPCPSLSLIGTSSRAWFSEIEMTASAVARKVFGALLLRGGGEWFFGADGCGTWVVAMVPPAGEDQQAPDSAPGDVRLTINLCV